MGVTVRDSPDYEGVGLPSHNIADYGLMSDVEDCSILLLAVRMGHFGMHPEYSIELAPELPYLF